eukprot:CAMPEP_0194526014 /NCGR_PEP_ID=MMETSP0253-20130528/61690_1 /TAXON_ID=2966 /ORGANISM="Noctiluca scintillans" /LENGTH=1039 /DNA_ID=CAMNT_0039370801 /DNA_START=11 /DNA_END=3130 /DNA_ORIENTATION=-
MTTGRLDGIAMVGAPAPCIGYCTPGAVRSSARSEVPTRFEHDPYTPTTRHPSWVPVERSPGGIGVALGSTRHHALSSWPSHNSANGYGPIQDSCGSAPLDLVSGGRVVSVQNVTRDALVAAGRVTEAPRGASMLFATGPVRAPGQMCAEGRSAIRDPVPTQTGVHVARRRSPVQDEILTRTAPSSQAPTPMRSTNASAQGTPQRRSIPQATVPTRSPYGLQKEEVDQMLARAQATSPAVAFETLPVQPPPYFEQATPKEPGGASRWQSLCEAAPHVPGFDPSVAAPAAATGAGSEFSGIAPLADSSAGYSYPGVPAAVGQGMTSGYNGFADSSATVPPNNGLAYETQPVVPGAFADYHGADLPATQPVVADYYGASLPATQPTIRDYPGGTLPATQPAVADFYGASAPATQPALGNYFGATVPATQPAMEHAVSTGVADTAAKQPARDYGFTAATTSASQYHDPPSISDYGFASEMAREQVSVQGNYGGQHAAAPVETPSIIDHGFSYEDSWAGMTGPAALARDVDTGLMPAVSHDEQSMVPQNSQDYSLEGPVPDAMISVYIIYEVPDAEVDFFIERIKDFYERTMVEEDMLFYGFTSCDNQFQCREAYRSAEALLLHMQSVEETTGSVMQYMRSLEIHGPPDELSRLQDPLAAFDPMLFSSGEELRNFAGPQEQLVVDSMVCIYPYFEVPDNEIDEFATLFAEFYGRTAQEPDMLYFGFTQSGNVFHCREAYRSGEAVLAHLENVSDVFNEASKYLTRLAIDGPAPELDKIRPHTEQLGASFWVLDGDAFSRILRPTFGIVSGCTFFEVPDPEVDEFLASCREFSNRTMMEADVLYFGLTQCGNQFHIRDAYCNAEGVLAHLQNVDPVFGEIGRYITRIEFHGPLEELQRLQEPTANLSPSLFVSGQELRNFSGPQEQLVEDPMVVFQPYFEVPEDRISEFATLFGDFYGLTSQEPDMLFYGFTQCDNTFLCRAAFRSGDAVLAHLENVREPMEQAQPYLRSMAFHGPEADLEHIRAHTSLGAEYWSLDAGAFSRLI